MKRVTGIGGIFFKSKDPKKITEWYQKHLGLNTNPYGATFEWFEDKNDTQKAQTQWSPFLEKHSIFCAITASVYDKLQGVENLKNLLKS
ncbi:MAG: hypothetical protein M9931_10910 [Chitinophagales bacterium]|nr:hypothetical protein [Chitinophagales bacterium]